MFTEQILPDGEQKPQTKQLQTRVDYLLKVLQKLVTAQKIKEEVSRPRKKVPSKHPKKENEHGHFEETKKDKNKRKSPKDKFKSKDSHKDSHKGTRDDESSKKKKKKEHKKDKKKKSKRDFNAPALHITANAEPQLIDAAGDLEPQVFTQCKEKMRPVKKTLKQFDIKGKSQTEQLDHMKHCLIIIGGRIKECMDEFKDDPEKSREWRNYLWTFVARFTDFPPKKLYKLYKRAIKKPEEGEEEDNNHHFHHHSNRYSRHHHSPRNHSSNKHHGDGPEGQNGPSSNSSSLPHNVIPLKRPSSQNVQSHSGGPKQTSPLKRSRNDYIRGPSHQVPPTMFNNLHRNSYNYHHHHSNAPPPMSLHLPPPPPPHPSSLMTSRTSWPNPNLSSRCDNKYNHSQRQDRYRPYSRPGIDMPDKKFRH